MYGVHHFAYDSILTMSLTKNCFDSINLFKCEIFFTIASAAHTHTLSHTRTHIHYHFFQISVCKLVLWLCLYLDWWIPYEPVRECQSNIFSTYLRFFMEHELITTIDTYVRATSCHTKNRLFCWNLSWNSKEEKSRNDWVFDALQTVLWIRTNGNKHNDNRIQTFSSIH